MSESLEMAAAAVKARLDAGESFHFVDVREPEEFALARIEGARLIPMRSVPAALAELDDDRPVIVLCHHGVRSLHVANWLREHGIEQVWSLTGGIDRWSLEIDASVPRY